MIHFGMTWTFHVSSVGMGISRIFVWGHTGFQFIDRKFKRAYVCTEILIYLFTYLGIYIVIYNK